MDKQITIQALEMFLKDIGKALNKADEARKKDVAKLEKKMNKLKEYSSVDEINEAWGYDCITTKERDELLEQFRDLQSSNKSLLDADTPVTEYMKILIKQMEEIRLDIEDLQKSEV